MSRLSKKFLKLGTGTNELNSQDIPANFSPSNYTPVAVGSEGTDKISSNLKGIDNKIFSSATDIRDTSFAGANNQSSAANVTGLAFANGSVRAFEAQVSVFVDATSDLFESFKLKAIQRGSDWSMSVSSEGDDSQVVFSITNAGQIQYTSANYSGFSALTMHFRAETLGV